jgi:hypothetical protein
MQRKPRCVLIISHTIFLSILCPFRYEGPSITERKAVDGLAFEVFVGVQVLAGGVDVGVAKEFLDSDDVASTLQQPRSVRVAEFGEGCVFDVCLGGDGFEFAKEMCQSPAFGIGENRRGGGPKQTPQAERVKQILGENHNLQNDLVVVAGDLNDTPKSQR